MSDRFMGRYRIPPARLSGYDYSQNGLYFVTICTKGKQPYFGNLVSGDMRPAHIGDIAIKYWGRISEIFPFVQLDAFQLMPDHLHGILCFNKSLGSDDCAGKHSTPIVGDDLPEHRNAFGPQSRNLASVVRGFKGSVKAYATTNQIPFAWQARFHEHIIRNERSLFAIRNYIWNNPTNG